MGNFNRDDRSGNRGGYQSRGRSSFGGNRRSFDRGGDRGDRTMYKAVCSNCGKECEVPFKPTGSKPVYCSDCFEKMGGREQQYSPRPERSDFRPSTSSFDNNKAQFDALSAKLDKILRLLEPKVPETVSAPIEEKIKAPKVKKEVKEITSEK